MNKFNKYLVLSLFTFFLLIINCNALDYDFNSFKVDIVVYENNTLDITETIVANFYVPKHGIYKSIPYYNTVIREDGSSEKNRVKIYNIDVNDKYSLKKKSGYLNIQIGDVDKYVNGLNEYVIKYSYELGNDKNDNFDELYFNIIGTEWEREIKNISFTITMPKDFDTSKLGFTHGRYGYSYTDGISYEINDNVISGTYNGSLSAYEGLTVRLELPEGYFIKDSVFNHLLELLIYVVPILLVVVSYKIWKKYGKDKLVVDVVEFYPPDGLNSLDVAYIKKGSVNNNDVVSLLIYLANKGYLSIDDSEKNGDEIIITKLKDYDGNNEEERRFFVGLFSHGDVVTDNDLKESFYTTINSIIGSKSKLKNKSLVFDLNSSWKRVPLYFIFLICMLFSIVIPIIGYREYHLLLSICSTYFFGTLFIALGCALIYDSNNTKSRIYISMVCCMIGLFILSVIGIYIVDINLVLGDVVYSIGFIISIICAILIYLFYIIVTRRTDYGTQILGRINGFKNFLDTVEKEKLEMLVEENPLYFYDILPYTYVLGISNKWIKKFEDIALMPPSWYENGNYYDTRKMCMNLDRTIHRVNRTMVSVPRPKNNDGFSGRGGGFSGGGFSGGGFSGGGSGGGGGGAW